MKVYKRKTKSLKEAIWPVLAKVPDNIIPFKEKANWSRRLDLAWMLGDNPDARIRAVVADEIETAIEEGGDFVKRMEGELKLCCYSESDREAIENSIRGIKELIDHLPDTCSPQAGESQRDATSVTDSDRVMARLTLLGDLMAQNIEKTQKIDAIRFHVTEPLYHLLANKRPKLDEDVRQRLVETITTNEFLNENFHQWAVETLGYLGHDGKSCRWMMDSLQRASRQYSPRGYINEIYSMVARLGEITPPSDRKMVLDFLDRLESDISKKTSEARTPSAMHQYEKLKVILLQVRHDLGNLDPVRRTLWDENNRYGIRSLAVRLYADSCDIPDDEKREVLKRVFTQVFEESKKMVELQKSIPSDQEYLVDPVIEWFAKHGNESDLKYFMERAKEGKDLLEKTGRMPLNSESMLVLVGGVSLMVARVQPELTPPMRQAIQDFKVFKRQVREHEDATLHDLQYYEAIDEIDMYAPSFLAQLIQMRSGNFREAMIETFSATW